MATQDDYVAAREQFRPFAKTLEPVELFCRVRREGYSRFTAYALMRDLHDMNLEECMAVERAADELPIPE
jgi:hypothetical protein